MTRSLNPREKAVTNLSDGYPWGLWITCDVLAGTALGCGG
jgi:Ni/Fe-hydrogenase subunit HybB-like protein